MCRSLTGGAHETGMHYAGEVVFSWESMAPATHVDYTLTQMTYPSIVAKHILPLSWKQYSLMAVASFSRIIPLVTK